MKLAVCFISIFFLSCCSLYAQDIFVPPTVHAAEVDNAPAIDGVLDDACWKSCEKLAGFKESYHGTDATQPTEIMLCRDKEHLYIAWVCHDAQPSLIQAQQKQRNSNLATEDYVRILLDPQNSHLKDYRFDVNPLGTQCEYVPTGAAGNITWRGDWYASAKITADGWCAEVSIPFKMLHYPKNSNTFAIAFKRYVSRLAETSAWPDLGPNSELVRFAQLTELDLPDQSSRPVLMPYTVSSREPGASFNDIGFDFKQELPNDVTAMATYNPDFTDIQSAVASVAYSYTEKQLPEQRPFFQEGSGFFPDSTAFYSSQRIGDIDYGVKSFGKVGKQSFGFLDAVKRGEENHFASTYSYDANPDMGYSVYFTGSTVQQQFKADPNDPDSSLCIAPGFVRRWRDDTTSTTLNVRRYTSINSNGGPMGSLFNASMTKSTAPRHFGYTVTLSQTDSDYYVRDAYIPLTGVRGVFVSYGFHDRPTRGRFNFWNTYVDINQYWKEEGGIHHQSIALNSNCDTRSEWLLGTTLTAGNWLGQNDSTITLKLGWLRRHVYGGGTTHYTFGKRNGLDYSEWRVDQSYKASDKLVFTFAYEWNKLAEISGDIKQSQATLMTTYEMSPERSLGLWLVNRDSDLNMCITYRQSVRSGSDIYLIYGYPNSLNTEQRLALKVVTPVTW